MSYSQTDTDIKWAGMQADAQKLLDEVTHDHGLPSVLGMLAQTCDFKEAVARSEKCLTASGFESMAAIIRDAAKSIRSIKWEYPP